MAVVARSLLPHLVVVATLVDAAIVVALGLHSYTGVFAFAALFVATLPTVYALAVFLQPDPVSDRDADGA
jgi:hypothetical protein